MSTTAAGGRRSSASPSAGPAGSGWRLAQDARAGLVEAVRVGLRPGSPRGAEDDPAATPGLQSAPLSDAGATTLGPVAVSLSARQHGDAATLALEIESRARAPIPVESVVVGLRWSGHGLADLRFLRHGWQSWSFTAPRDLDDAGEPAFPSGPWLRGMHHAVGEPAPDRAGWHESDLVTVAAARARGPACLAGVLETGRAFGLVYLRRDGDAVAMEVEQRLEIDLEPGERVRLEGVRVALGDDAGALLERFASLHGRVAEARTRAPFQTGWCSWYHFFHDVCEDDVLRNLDVLTRARGEIPVDVVQLDDGYQRAIGDWLETNPKFPRGLAPVATAIREAGFTPGLWTAPFCVTSESRIFERHPEWLLRDGERPFRALLHREWSADAEVYALDATRREVVEHLEALFRSLVDMGFRYQKLDFLYSLAMQCEAHDPAVTRAARLRRGLDAIRRGVGDDVFLLGCGCPLGAAVGVVDGMRIGPDVAPSWEIDGDFVVPGLEPALPSTRSAIRSVLNRAWMHRRLWLNDPDCLMVRTRETKLATEESRALAAAVAGTGGMVVFSDDVAGLPADRRALVAETIAVAREVDAASPVGAARARDLMEREIPSLVTVASGRDAIVSVWNAEETARETQLSDAGVDRASLAGIDPLLGSGSPDGDGSVRLAAHDAALVRIPDALRPVVFCDFDGTFSVQDVGSTLAKRHAGERRAGLWPRIESGELTPWAFNMELLDGLALPESELDDFLETVELDPGAADLVEWCRARDVPFLVLSDGFDWNLDRLQKIHGVRFEYRANHLRYEDGRWQLAPGGPDADCGCGTGTCKRAQIESWRRTHPGAFCVHVGNGRVSDLCGAVAADLAFAKDTLAPALDERGVAYEPFETLHDVVAALERALG